MKKCPLFMSIATLAALVNLTAFVHAANFIGPTNYLSATNSPFNGTDFDYFHLEDFEDQMINVPGIVVTNGTGVTSVVFGPDFPNIDSVDADDGSIDGSGSNGDSYFATSGSVGVSFTFNSIVLGNFPTHAGIVWTDGLGTTTFQAFDVNDNLLGVIGPVSIANNATDGDTDEDSFFGVTSSDGIARIRISNTSGGIEVDHLQYGSASDLDSDGDGITDAFDNCTISANPDQVDTDNDGYGNRCDGDFNNDCTINFVDLAAFSPEFQGTNPLFDMVTDGVVNFLDFTVLANLFLSPPGPGLGSCGAP